MSNAAIKLEVETYFMEQWELINPTVPVAHGNMAFEPPDELPWIRFSVQPGSRLVSGIFSDCRQFIGIVTVSVFIPLQTGTADSDKLIDDASDIFVAAKLSTEFRDMFVTEVGEDEKHFYRTNLIIDYVSNY